jgi:alpha/beta superfamily hydrolase
VGLVLLTRLKHPTFSGPAGPLEAVLHEVPDRPHELAAVVCHPHPMFGGTLHNKVVHRVATTLHELGAEVLRFNFRGVGRSAGRFDQGAGELEDARAALAWMRTRYPRARPWLAGFSFGAWVAARLAASEPRVERLILVAPGVSKSDFDVLRYCAVPKLVIQGLADTTCPPADLAPEYQRWAEPKQLVEVPDATHFFDRRLDALSAAISGALAEAAKGARS